MPNALLQSGLDLAIAAIQVLFSAIIPVALWRLAVWHRRHEGLEHRLHEATGRVIDERIRAVATQLDCHSRSASAGQEELRQRLSATEGVLAAMAERDNKAELDLATRLDLLKDHIRQYTICKTDLDRYEAAVDRRLNRIETRLEDLAA